MTPKSSRSFSILILTGRSFHMVSRPQGARLDDPGWASVAGRSRGPVRGTIAKTSKVAAFLLALLAAACAGAQPPKSTVNVPDKLKPGANESLAMIVPAKGVQIYECRARRIKSEDTNGRSWLPKPISSTRAGTGSADTMPAHTGNRPMAARSGYGEGTRRRASGRRYAWLLLAATSVGSEGSFSKVTSIQRVSTVGGVAPKAGCSQAAAGTPARIDYTADYYFFTAK